MRFSGERRLKAKGIVIISPVVCKGETAYIKLSGITGGDGKHQSCNSMCTVVIVQTGGYEKMTKRHIHVYVLAVVTGVICIGWTLATGMERTGGALQPDPADPVFTSPSEPLPAVQYKIDASQSHFMVKVFKDGLLSVLAHDHSVAIRDFSGVAQFNPGPISPASLQITIKSESLAVTDKVSASDRAKIEKTMREEVLEVDKYPEIVFKSTKIDIDKSENGQYQAKVFGELTLHGVTKSGLITAMVTMSDNNLHAKGNFDLHQTQYSIKPVSAGGGTIKVKDQLKFTFDIVAHP